MKQFFLIFAFLLGYCLAASAEKVKLIPSADDSTRMDTVVISDLNDADYHTSYRYESTDGLLKDIASQTATIAIISMIIICGLPIFIVAIVLWFRYKNKQAKYKLAAEALAAGQSIPKGLFTEAENQNNKILSKGIKNIFLGIGLGVFFWIATMHSGLASIGFLISCLGVGQVLIAFTTRPKERRHDMNPTESPTNENLKEE